MFFQMTAPYASLYRLANLRLRKMLDLLDLPEYQADIFILSEQEMRSLKRATTGLSRKHVNVLSFPAVVGFIYPNCAPGMYLGEIYLNGQAYGRRPAQFTFLLAHGLLHLLGYDHQNLQSAKAMEQMEDFLTG